MISITRIEAVADDMIELESDWGTFSLQFGDLYELDDEDDWEPVDWDIVEEDQETLLAYQTIRTELQEFIK